MNWLWLPGDQSTGVAILNFYYSLEVGIGIILGFPVHPSSDFAYLFNNRVFFNFYHSINSSGEQIAGRIFTFDKKRLIIHLL